MDVCITNNGYISCFNSWIYSLLIKNYPNVVDTEPIYNQYLFSTLPLEVFNISDNLEQAQFFDVYDKEKHSDIDNSFLSMSESVGYYATTEKIDIGKMLLKNTN